MFTSTFTFAKGRFDDDFHALMDHPSHREAKARQSAWLEGYQVVIAEVIRTDGDGRIGHPLQGAR